MNARMKGRHEAEYAWFAIADSLPGLSMSADRAARQIIEACRYGEPELTIALPARAAMMLNAIAPSITARIVALAAWLLPAPAGPEGDRSKHGRESESAWPRRSRPRRATTTRLEGITPNVFV